MQVDVENPVPSRRKNGMPLRKKILIIAGIIAILMCIIGGAMLALQPKEQPQQVVVDPSFKINLSYELGLIPDAHNQRIIKITHNNGDNINDISKDLWITIYPPENTPYLKRSLVIHKAKYLSFEPGDALYIYLGLDGLFYCAKEIPPYTEFVDLPNGEWEIHVDDAIYQTSISKYKFGIYDSITYLLKTPDILDNIILGMPEYSTIFIYGEIYREQIVVGKPMRLIGYNGPVIDGGGVGNTITITAPEVTISGIEIQNSGTSATSDSCIIVKKTKQATIYNNYIHSCNNGIIIDSSYLSDIRNNTISDYDLAGVLVNSGSERNVIKHNQVSIGTIGIYLTGDANSNYIVDNYGTGNTRYGILIENKLKNTYEYNDFPLNEYNYNTTKAIEAAKEWDPSNDDLW